MVTEKQGEEAIVSSNLNENDQGNNLDTKEGEDDHSMFGLKSFLWHGGSVWDAWFSCASNQVSLSAFDIIVNGINILRLGV